MSYCRKEGKDQIIFVTKEDYEKPSTALVASATDEDEEPGLILKDGSINWNCPCLGGMASGPCGVQFREAFSCFHYSELQPKGSECYDAFKTMQECMSEYPDLYPSKDEEEVPESDSKKLENVENKDEPQTDVTSTPLPPTAEVS
ncbi:mitochondrial intermembrane space import and assembly protein 40-like [Octopus sinensis]|uniref:Mitochondrial intermembrane space import and assembly protein 40-like n=1 Tax=Octopus sinensis TaxID=2607531 RepID=A0A6P7SN34_9MOLL|nr:mitochondrial intermembrane space import and assembly protein 40-like [Octopus sinensis]